MLQRLVRQALANNLDLRRAIARIEQAQAQVQVTAAPLFPQLGYSGSATRQQVVTAPSEIRSVDYNTYIGAVALSWELDIWGRIRRATESAQAELLATEDFRRGMVVTLLSGVATAYFQLLALDRDLEIAWETVALYRKTLDLFKQKYEGGAANRP